MTKSTPTPTQAPPGADYCTPRQAAKTIGVSYQRIINLIHAGRIARRRWDGRWFVSKAEVMERKARREETVRGRATCDGGTQ